MDKIPASGKYDFFITGVKKCSTTALEHFLRVHPELKFKHLIAGEGHYFDVACRLKVTVHSIFIQCQIFFCRKMNGDSESQILEPIKPKIREKKIKKMPCSKYFPKSERNILLENIFWLSITFTPQEIRKIM